jgi:lysyl-tRNA synthetase class 2
MKRIFEQRMAKLREIVDRGVNPYPHRFEPTHRSDDIKGDFDRLASAEAVVSAAGRLMSKRPHGKTAFGHIRDLRGDIQVYFRMDELGEEGFELLDLIEVGDFIGAKGTIFKTRTGEITIRATEVVLLSKSLRPLPEKWHGLKDKETRYRRRYVDLFVNLEVRKVFLERTAIIGCMRELLDQKGFIEVETPVLQPIYGGGNAEPFETHHSKLDMKLYLRIADELYLKRLLVGGLERVYEISKDFRNEGMDRTHSPEFTQLELYQAYADYNDMMEIFEEIMEAVALGLRGTTEITYQGTSLNLKRPWRRIRVLEALREYADIDLDSVTDDRLRSVCSEITDADWEVASRGAMIDEILGHFVEPRLIEPTILCDYPVEIYLSRFGEWLITGEILNSPDNLSAIHGSRFNKS